MTATAAIARLEGRKLLRHPAFLVGVGFVGIGALAFAAAIRSEPAASWDEDGWTVAVALFLLAILTMVAANNVALRDRREHTTEQFGALPVGVPVRVAGLLAALLWPAVAASLLLAVVVVGARVAGAQLGDMQAIGAVELMVIVLMLGALGVAIGQWFPNPFVVPVLAWGFFLVSPGEPARAWHALTPLAQPTTVSLAMLHLGYVVALTILLSVLAVGRSRGLRTMVVPFAVAVVLVVVLAAMLVTSVCPSGGSCRL